MKEWRGIWLPDEEQHLQQWMEKKNQIIDGKPTYQYNKLRAAVDYCTGFGTAIDVGAHCGLWSMHLVKEFNKVLAFEPIAAHRECFFKNVTEGHSHLYHYAVGAEEGYVDFVFERRSTGGTRVGDFSKEPVGTHTKMVTLDSMALDCDFLKLDCEGYEIYILTGAIRMIKRCKPVIIVEQKPGRAQKYGQEETGAIPFLEAHGYTFREKISGDYIMTPQ